MGYNGRYKHENYLQWRDRHGSYHNFPSTMGKNCNRNQPTMTNDTIVMNDQSLLPITGVRYGPIRFDQQIAKVSISPLQCEPYTDVPLSTRFGVVNETVIEIQSTLSSFVENVNDTFSTLKEDL